MIKINRFYLLITAFVLLKTSNTFAISCDDIDGPQECYDIYSKYSIQYSEYHSNGYSFCLMWDGLEDADGNNLPNSICEEIDTESLAEDCCMGYADDCASVLTGRKTCDIDTGSGGGTEEIICSNGYYFNSQTNTCSKCPVYDEAYWNGSNYSAYAETTSNGDRQFGSGGLSVCYVPRNITFSDTTGSYAFMYNCYHNGIVGT